LEKQAQLKIKDKRRLLDKSWTQGGTKEIGKITNPTTHKIRLARGMRPKK